MLWIDSASCDTLQGFYKKKFCKCQILMLKLGLLMHVHLSTVPIFRFEAALSKNLIIYHLILCMCIKTCLYR